MDFKLLEAFINVAKYKNFSKAANSINVSQPAVSSHIAKLEKELKAQLFDRTSKEVVLTPAGHSFVKYAIDILDARDRAIMNLSSFNQEVKGTLHIGASTTPCNVLLPQLLVDFHAAYPRVCFNVAEEDSGSVAQRVLSLESEIGIVGKVVNDEKIDCFKLADDEIVVISPPSLALPEEVTLKALLSNEFILRDGNSATRKTFEDALLAKGVAVGSISIPYEVNSLDTQIEFVKAGLGISVISAQICEQYAESGLIRKSSIKGIAMKRSIYLLVRSNRTLSPTANAFFNYCRERYKF
jgi:DNA-binding transcriptional LysR family regulator